MHYHKKVDVVLDLVGGDVLKQSHHVLTKGGRLISIVGQPDQKLAEQNGIIAKLVYYAPSADDLKTLSDLADQGKQIGDRTYLPFNCGRNQRSS
jgi:NADPH:quinone reductase-like Zn-dependent oxidoreductase